MSNILDGIKLEVNSNIKSVMKQFKHLDLEKRDMALAKGLIQYAYGVRKRSIGHVKKVLHRPLRYTFNSLLVQTGNGYEPLKTSEWKKLRGNGYRIYIRHRDGFDTGKSGTPPAEYLNTLVEGGSRKFKGLERQLQSTILTAGQYVIPGREFRNINGNLPKGIANEMLTDLRTQATAGYDSIGTKTRKQRRTTKAQITKNHGIKEFVYMTPNGGRQRPGVYERYRAIGDSNSTLRPALIVTNKKPMYKKNTYPFYNFLNKDVDQNLEDVLFQHFDKLDT